MTDIQVVGYRDSYGDLDVRVFLDGQYHDAEVTFVDPEREDLPLSELRRRQRAAIRQGGEVGDYLWELYSEAETSEFVDHDLRATVAVDATPDAVDVEQIDEQVWIRNGVVPVGLYPHDVLSNNTSRAGYALAALRRYVYTLRHPYVGHVEYGSARLAELVPPDTHPATVAGLRRFVSVTGSDLVTLDALLEDLLMCLWHLGDAWSVNLDVPGSWSLPRLGGWLPSFYVVLEQFAVEAVQHGALAGDFSEIEHRALERYHQQVTGNDTSG